KADAGTRSSGAARRSRDVLPEMFHPAKAAVAAKRAVAGMARRTGTFDASRYFRGTNDLGFYNVGTTQLRALARSIYLEHRADWPIDHAMAFANALSVDRYLEVKCLGIEVVARYRRDFRPGLLAAWKRWLVYSANWATTDSICGLLIGPLLAQQPELCA